MSKPSLKGPSRPNKGVHIGVPFHREERVAEQTCALPSIAKAEYQAELRPVAKTEAWVLFLSYSQKGYGALYRAGDGSGSWYGLEHGPYREPSRFQLAATHTLLLPGSKESPGLYLLSWHKC